jgi:hypothetical protein
MYHIITYKLEGDGVTRVDIQLGRGIGKLSRVDPKGALLRRNGLNWQWRERQHQSSHYKKRRETKERILYATL